MWKSSKLYLWNAVWLDAGQLTKRGFLTLRDSLVVIYASITFAPFCFTCERAIESSWFYTFDKVPKVCRIIFPLTAICPKKGLSDRLTGRIATASFTDRLIRYALAFCSQNMSAHDYQNTGVVFLTSSLNCLKSVRLSLMSCLTSYTYGSRLLESARVRIIFPPKLEHLFFPWQLCRYSLFLFIFKI